MTHVVALVPIGILQNYRAFEFVFVILVHRSRPSLYPVRSVRRTSLRTFCMNRRSLGVADNITTLPFGSFSR
jgi:hypothetical protein